ncbi:MAG TPA: C4-dicarboxylate transporter DctA [Candidatus Sulfotelmatobacter sp.]|nr:C4-dicarboxylate transporter DctA [Candidatus Sulfotelmatobacter sp.]
MNFQRHLRQPYVLVIGALLAGVAFGILSPGTAVKMKPLGDAFINLVKLLIAPIIFCTVVHGMAAMGSLKKLGRVGGKTLLYFEAVSTLALVIGLVVVNVFKPGAGFNIDPATLDPDAVKNYTAGAHALNTVDFLMNLIPKTFFGAFVSGDLLQVLVVAALTAFALQGLGERGQPVLRAIDLAAQIFFGIMRIVVMFAPFGVFGAMAFTVGSSGARSLVYLTGLIAGFYLTALIFIVFVLGAIAWFSGFSIFRFLNFIREELVLVLGTSSSETALPGLIQKMKRLGCAESTVGLVIPTGYSFNLDGTNIYMAMAAVFLAQATNTPLDLPHQLSLLLVAMITSKGASGVTGAGFICLAATLATVPAVPVASLALLVGIDRLMSQCRSFTNLVGNGVATVVISRWENEVSAKTLQKNLAITP